MNVESMFARGQARDIGHDFHFFAGFGEGNRAHDVVTGRGMQNGDRLGRVTGERRGIENKKRGDDQTAAAQR